MKRNYKGKYIFRGTIIGIVIGIIVSILTKKSVSEALCTSIGFLFGVILEIYKNKKRAIKSL